jgi:hypothetical protein
MRKISFTTQAVVRSDRAIPPWGFRFRWFFAD